MRKLQRIAYLACVMSATACAHPRAIVLSPTAPQGLRVNGIGEASAPPDIVRTRLGIEVRAAAAEQASADAAQRMAALIIALKQLGIADKDLRTFNYSINFEQEQPQPTPPPAAARDAKEPASQLPRGHYRVSNMLEVTVRDLDKIGGVLQGAMAAGANNVWGITFDLEDDTALVAKAREDAVADAKHTASELARLAGVELGEVVSLTEAEEPAPGVGPALYAMRSEAANEIPIERGEITVRYAIQVTYTVQGK
ncbi:MAG: SIMPL domain-containing protein [Polyangiales bacterium]